MTENKSSKWPERDSNPGPLDNLQVQRADHLAMLPLFIFICTLDDLHRENRGSVNRLTLQQRGLQIPMRICKEIMFKKLS